MEVIGGDDLWERQMEVASGSDMWERLVAVADGSDPSCILYNNNLDKLRF